MAEKDSHKIWKNGIWFLLGCLAGFGVFLYLTHGNSQNSQKVISSSGTTLPNGSPSTESNERFKANQKQKPERRKQVIMCMIFTTVEQWQIKALAVRLTWAKRCDFHKFFYSKNPSKRIDEAYALNVEEGREHLTKKTLQALKVSYDFYKDHVDWFVKLDDDVYVIMENLRYILNQYDPSKPHYIGHKSSDYLTHGYNGGGASYSLSRRAAQSIVEKGPLIPQGCVRDGSFEDLDIGRCLAVMQIYPVDMRDEKSRLRFHPDHPIKLLQGDKSALSVYSYRIGNVTFGKHNGIAVMSPSMVTFHYMDPAHMYMYDFLLYDLQRPLHNVDN